MRNKFWTFDSILVAITLLCMWCCHCHFWIMFWAWHRIEIVQQPLHGLTWNFENLVKIWNIAQPPSPNNNNNNCSLHTKCTFSHLKILWRWQTCCRRQHRGVEKCCMNYRKSAHAEDHEIYGDAHLLEKEADHVRLLGHLMGPRCCLPIICVLQTWLLLKPEPGIFLLIYNYDYALNTWLLYSHAYLAQVHFRTPDIMFPDWLLPYHICTYVFTWLWHRLVLHLM